MLGQDVSQYEHKMPRSVLPKQYCNEARKREARAFFLGFPREKNLFVLREWGASLVIFCFCVSLLCHCVIVCDSSLFSTTFFHRAQRTRRQCQSRRALCTQTHKRNLLMLVRLEFVQSWSSYNSRYGNVCRHTWLGQAEPKHV